MHDDGTTMARDDQNYKNISGESKEGNKDIFSNQNG